MDIPVQQIVSDESNGKCWLYKAANGVMYEIVENNQNMVLNYTISNTNDDNSTTVNTWWEVLEYFSNLE